jgi:hypothetical protein
MSKVAHDVALQEFERICDAYDLDTETSDKEENEAFEIKKNHIIKAIEKGQITVDEEGFPTVHLKYPVGEFAKVTFKVVTGGAIVSMGDTKSKNNTTKGWQVLADLTGQPTTLFGKMHMRPDLLNCEMLKSLFLG